VDVPVVQLIVIMDVHLVLVIVLVVVGEVVVLQLVKVDVREDVLPLVVPGVQKYLIDDSHD